MPIHGEYRMQAANARMAQEAACRRVDHPRENGQSSSSGRRGANRATWTRGWTFVDGLGVGDIGDVALRDRRTWPRTCSDHHCDARELQRARTAAAELIARGFAETDPARRDAREAENVLRSCIADNILEIKLLQEHLRRRRAAGLRPHQARADDPAGRRRGLAILQSKMASGWAGVLARSAASEETGRRLIAQLSACEVSALAFCRLLERWARGDAQPSTPGQRQAALRRAADRAETALTGLERPSALPARAGARAGGRPLLVRRTRLRRAA